VPSVRFIQRRTGVAIVGPLLAAGVDADGLEPPAGAAPLEIPLEVSRLGENVAPMPKPRQLELRRRPRHRTTVLPSPDHGACAVFAWAAGQEEPRRRSEV
jgi:hypothetical protein